jgi:hypothetical protein
MRRCLAGAGLLLLRAARVGLAGDYIDPISIITAQDEALYSHSAIAMARGGRLAHAAIHGAIRPLQTSAPGLDSRSLGQTSRDFETFPATAQCDPLRACSGLIFLWAAELAGWAAGAVAGALLLCNHLWYTWPRFA